ncbi:zinc-binding protein A33-like isoform X3 [Centrocercus urophasianus]|uniref:zinc-binding protein A33-like isoform X3 n=1 Tax=Centrocercus urophasianus TaxID=9002 RepID=UPI001C64D038|nr:zinc-binding protein A33-like isoform X3 [Centrocercus urophasianus]
MFSSCGFVLATACSKLPFRSDLKALQETAWQMNSPEMSCFFFCVLLLLQMARAETLDVSKLIEANHNLLIGVTALVSILLLMAIIIVFYYCFCSVNGSKDPEGDPERGSLIPDNSEGNTPAEEVSPSEETIISASEKLDEEIESLRRRTDKNSVTFDADTAHPRLEVFDEGKSVKDTGTNRDVAMNSKRFDSHIFILATEGFNTGKHYWEVDVGKKNSWELGVASEAVTRKGTVILCPRNGFWVMALSDGVEYWACTDPWTRLNVRSKPRKIGMLLDISAGQLSFYDPQGQTTLYTFNIAESDKKGKFFPFFSMGNSAGKKDPEPLKLCS